MEREPVAEQYSKSERNRAAGHGRFAGLETGIPANESGNDLCIHNACAEYICSRTRTIGIGGNPVSGNVHESDPAVPFAVPFAVA